jgi:malate:Na+ symporter
MLFTFGLVLTPWERLVEGLASANLVTIVATVSAKVMTGFFTSRLVRHPSAAGSRRRRPRSGRGVGTLKPLTTTTDDATMAGIPKSTA